MITLVALVGLAWSLGTLRPILSCCCPRRAGRSNEGVGAPPGPDAPRVAVDLPSLELAKGFVALELTGPDGPRAVDKEYYLRKTRGRGVGVNLATCWSNLPKEPLDCSPPGKAVLELTAPAY